MRSRPGMTGKLAAKPAKWREIKGKSHLGSHFGHEIPISFHRNPKNHILSAFHSL
jgi:hypothetical protein